ncbi:ATP-binding protein [Pseudarthrobacter sp. RMG13]|uniref:ATP-binding protein n=1 Tax=Pseudarthrobacter humi TaxID=2952523 RepID=A0ABT1LRQ4_9MICC|nr:ATP-binding protein [Pseudarthrobacter humi]MCP9001128.1 ATP-binding protein [Pseudarthrobacter humi]
MLQRDAAPHTGRQSATLELLAARPETATGFLAQFRLRMDNNSVLKEQVISLVMSEYGPSTAGVTFHHRPSLPASDVIMPDGLLQKVTDHTVGIATHRASLKQHGQHLKRGILLYGRPGTGKTHTVRHLLSQSEGSTAILLSGGSLARISEAARMARALQPSIVKVLDAMDGLDNDADVAFVLTTNRPDMLERALAQRPGRVDLAVEIPLPAHAERVRLLELYGRLVAFSPAALDAAAERTAGTTASFARELVRRAVVAAALDTTPVSDSHLAAAVEDLMADAETLTRSLLGSGTDAAGLPGPAFLGPGFPGPGFPQPGMPGPADSL